MPFGMSCQRPGTSGFRLLARFALWEWANLKNDDGVVCAFVLGWVFNLKRWQADPNDDTGPRSHSASAAEYEPC